MGGYKFSDDPLSAGGFGPADATIRVRPGPVRTTLIRPRSGNPFNDMRSWPMEPTGQPWYQKYGSVVRYHDHASIVVSNTTASWRICVLRIASAYVTAAQAHRATLDKADKRTTALTLSAMWSVVSVGVTGLASPLLSNAGDVLKDMTTTATGSIGNWGPPISYYFRDPPDGVDVEPGVYQNKLEEWIENVRTGFGSGLIAYRSTLSRMTPAEQSRYDVNKYRFELADALDKLTPLEGISALSNQTVNQMAKPLERRFWAEWILQQCSPKNGFGSVPGPVADRLDELGILKEAGTTISGFLHTLGDIPVLGIISAELGHTSKQEDLKLLTWANKFKASFDKSEWSKLTA